MVLHPPPPHHMDMRGPPPSGPPPRFHGGPHGGSPYQPRFGGGYRPRGGFRPHGDSSGFRPFFRPHQAHHKKDREAGPQPAGMHPGQGPQGSEEVAQEDLAGGGDDYDGKRLRKSLMRKTVDYNCSFQSMVEQRVWQRGDRRDKRALQPDHTYFHRVLPPVGAQENPSNAVTTRFVKTATNKMRCPVFTLAWTPEGRRLITGASSGEFTLWNGLTFNFETIQQAHDSSVRAMVWSHSDQWMLTGDHGGYVKLWQSNMNNVKMFQAHKEPVRCISFSPTDRKFATCSDDGTVRIWDFQTCTEERTLRGHGSDVKCVDWHPSKGIIASGSKDNQQPIKLWEPKSGKAITTLHAHKSTVMDIGWNKNGNWLLTASRDHLLKLFDIRNLKEEMQTFRGHKKEASTLAWHPVHEGLFASGGSDGSIMFWNVGASKEVGVIEEAHESIVWALAWHPIGHILCSGSNDHACKFWTRNRPGDTMRDKYNLNTLPIGQEDEIHAAETATANYAIPGMDEHGAEEDDSHMYGGDIGAPLRIPGLDPEPEPLDMGDKKIKTPYAKPIPKNFEASWNAMPSAPPPGPGGPPPPVGGPPPFDLAPPSQQPQFGAPPPALPGLPDGCISLEELQRTATAVVAYGSVYPVLPGSNLFMSIRNGDHAVKDVLRNEFFAG